MVLPIKGVSPWVVALGLLLASGLGALLPVERSAALADEPAPTPRYLIYPVTTELQRTLLRAEPDLCVVMDASAAMKGKDVSAPALNLDKLRADLVKQAKGKNHLHFELFHGSDKAGSQESSALVRYAVIGLGHDLGIPKTTASGFSLANGYERTWEEHIAPLLNKDPRNKPGDESPRGNDDVKVYPVQTDLSRYLTWNVDGVVFIKPAMDTEQGKIPEKIREAVIKTIDDLNLNQRKISFWVRAGKLKEDERRVLYQEINRLGEKVGSPSGYKTVY